MKAIRVSKDNINDVWSCPNVESIERCMASNKEERIIVKFRSGEFYVPEGWYVIEDDNRMHSVVSPQVYETFQRGCCNEQRDGICRLSPEREKELSNLAWEMLDGVLNSDLFAHLCEHSDESRKIRDKLRVLHACDKPLT